MKRYMIKAVNKEMSKQKQRENPTLQSKTPVTLKIVERKPFPVKKDRKAKLEKVMKKAVEKELREGMYVPGSHELKPKEKIRVYDKSGAVWEGKVKIPRKAVKKSKSNTERLHLKNLD